MPVEPHHRFYWEQFVPEDKGHAARIPSGDDLAALRRGLGREPGTIPAMWRFYRSWQDNGVRLTAEHHTLTLFAVHQQSQRHLVHSDHLTLAQALRGLHATGRFNQAAVDRRFFAAVTAREVPEVVHHLRGLVRQLRSLDAATSFDYTRLYWDLAGWRVPKRRQRAQRQWGLGYYGAHPDDPQSSPGPSTEGDS